MRSTTTDVHRRRLDLTDEPLEVLRRFRGRDRLVALLGAWHHGEALIACDPTHVSTDPFNLALPAPGSGLDTRPRARSSPAPLLDQRDRTSSSAPPVLDQGDGSTRWSSSGTASASERVPRIETTTAASRGDPAGFGGGWIGVWGYRLGRQIEEVPEPAARPVPQPDARVAFYAWVLRRERGTWWLEWLDDTDVSAVLALLDGDPPDDQPYRLAPFALTPSPDEHAAAVARAVEHIEAGDLFQVNLCARLEAAFEGDPLDVFCRGVAALNPAYGAFVDAPEGAVVSFSPELFLRRSGQEVLSSPIKGTAPIDPDPDRDAATVRELVASAKDRAENVMIVDLVRNDVGRVSAPGSVRVPALVRPERHAVWQLVSDVVGHLEPGVSDGDLLRATFPPGSVTGAPKVRAMEIAAALEATGREAYTGAIGQVSVGAGLELNVVIRTLEIADGRAWLGVGGGIVADSTPLGEVAELFTKARPVVEAVGGTLVDDVPPAREARPPAALPSPAESAADPGQGVFTTILVRDQRPLDVEVHVARLDASVRAVYGTTVRSGLEDAVGRRAAALPGGDHRLRVEAVPVSSPPARSTTGPEVRVRLRDAPLDAGPAEPWRLASRVVPGGWGAHKWIDRHALQPPGGVDDVLLIDSDGSVLETGRASIFVVLDDGVHTPPLDGRILPGTQRARVIDQLLAAGIPVHQRRLVLADFAAAAEVFATNALRGIVPIAAVDALPSWPVPGPLTAQLLEPPLPEVRRPSLAGASKGTTRVLFIDNYDSFVFNLVQYVRELGAHADVVRNDAVSVEDVLAAREAGDVTHVVISPGPGSPGDAGISVDLVRRLGPTTPILGVCLGHQAIAEAYGARVVRAPDVVHGKAALVHHDGRGLHVGLPTPLVVARYHSLVADESTLPPELEITSRTSTGVVMGLRHREHPVEGVQWHPESILTSHGHELLATFLAMAPPANRGSIDAWT